MRKDYGQSLYELKAYVNAYNLSTQLKNAELVASVNSFYKRYYALLIWNNLIQNNHIYQKRYSKAKSYRIYFKEAVSDICQSFFLAMQGCYKPAFLTLRSGIENYVRCIGINGDLKVVEIESVFELFETIKKDNTLKGSITASSCWNTLRQEYAMLCQYVHTASINHMSHVEFLNTFPGYNKAESDKFFHTAQKVITAIIILSIISFPSHFIKLHHTLQDAVRDVLSKFVKSKLFK